MLSLSVERHGYFEAVRIMSGKLGPPWNCWECLWLMGMKMGNEFYVIYEYCEYTSVQFSVLGLISSPAVNVNIRHLRGSLCDLKNIT